jgi:sugar phosphate isomerase/epimerase
MLTRRRFAALSAAAAGAALVAPLEVQAAPTRSGLEFGVQLFMVRDRVGPQDLAATLRMIHQIGYPSIETYPLVYNRPARELRALIADCGLKTTSGHFEYPTLEEHVDYAAELGLTYMVCPWIPKPIQDSLEGFHQAAAHFNLAAAKVKKAGLTFAFHPHNYEFKKYEGGRGFEILLRELDPAIKIELDIFWAVQGGENPLALMHTLRERLALIHIKDRKPSTSISFAPDAAAAALCTEAGAGTLDWKALLGEAHRMGITEYYVDQDATDIPIEESLRRNWKYLSQLAIG